MSLRTKKRQRTPSLQSPYTSSHNSSPSCYVGGTTVEYDPAMSHKEFVYINNTGEQLKQIAHSQYDTQTGTESQKNAKYDTANPNYYKHIYKPFLFETAKKMSDSLQMHKVTYTPQTQLFYMVPVAGITPSTSIAKTNIENDLIVNVICFGRSFTYLLIYLAYLFSNITKADGTARNNQILLYCDDESYTSYKNTHINFIQPNMNNVYQRGFHNQFGKNKEMYGLTPQHINILSKLNIYILHSSHYLMKGVGGKRAVIQYYNAKILAPQYSHHSTPFVSMTIDDNITGIYVLNNTCNVRDSNKSNIVYKDKHENIQHKIHKKTTNHPEGELCDMVTCIDVYDELAARLYHNNDLLLIGINKGKGATDSNLKNAESVKNTISIYKLNMTKPVQLFEHQYYYNPYFTRFYEDMAFNSEVGENGKTGVARSAKHTKFHLNFGHFTISQSNVCAGNIKEHDDDFPEYLKDMFMNITGIEPVYPMYYLYFASLFNANRVSVFIGDVDEDTIQGVSYPMFTFFDTADKSKVVKSPLAGKYANMYYPFYWFALAYVWNKQVFMQGRTRGKKQMMYHMCSSSKTVNNELLSATLIKWINMNIMNISPSTNNKNIYTYAFGETIQKLLSFDNNHLMDMFNGTYRTDESVHKQIRTNMCTEMRAFNKKHVSIEHIESIYNPTTSRKRIKQSPKHSITTMKKINTIPTLQSRKIQRTRKRYKI